MKRTVLYMSDKYDPNYISEYYDQYGEREWQRLELNPTNKVNFHVHQHYLTKFIQPNDQVLEAGAGAGRFTIELAKLGAKVTVGDISPGQLELNRRKVMEAGYERQITKREVLDVVDLSRFPSNHFDAVVCYGGAISYVFDKADDALRELLRVTRKGGILLLSVMSLLGASRRFLPSILSDVNLFGLEAIQQVMDTGDQNGDVSRGHHCRMYRWNELKSLLEKHTCSIIAVSAANFLSPNHEQVLQDLESNRPELWERFLQWEINFCQEPGALDGGTHIIAVVRKE
jgi:SAM-dependent methyltransferase